MKIFSFTKEELAYITRLVGKVRICNPKILHKQFLSQESTESATYQRRQRPEWWSDWRITVPWTFAKQQEKKLSTETMEKVKKIFSENIRLFVNVPTIWTLIWDRIVVKSSAKGFKLERF